MCNHIEMEFALVGFKHQEKLEKPEENPRSKDNNQHQTQPICNRGYQEYDPGHTGGKSAL